MSIEKIIKAMSPHLRRKVEIIAAREKLTFSQAVLFCLKR